MLSVRIVEDPKGAAPRMPRLVPGVKVYHRDGHTYASVADHGEATLYQQLRQNGVVWRTVKEGRRVNWGEPEEVGRRVAERLTREGELHPEEAEKMTRYQREGVGVACARGTFHFWWPPGAGKTFAGLVWALAVPGPILWATRAGAVWTVASEVKLRTTLEPHVWVAPSNRRKNYEETADYLARMKAEGRRPLIIVGYENLPDTHDPRADEDWVLVELENAPDVYIRSGALTDIRDYKPTSLVFDEIHRVRSHKRWSPIYRDDGRVDFEKKDNQAAAVMDLSGMAKRRLGLTGTPIPDRVRGLWATLDLVDPWQWGKFYDWAYRYCAAFEGAFGGIDTSGASHLDELEDRLQYVTHIVDPEEVAEGLPPFRRQVVRLRPEDLVKALDGWKSATKGALRAGGEAATEANLAINASRKRRWVAQTVGDALRAGQKVLVLTGLRKDAEALAALVQKEAPEAWVQWTHGEHDAHERQEMVDEYMALPGSACICATGDSIGESLNLQDTDMLVLAMIPWTPGQVVQWEGRVKGRLGQKRSVVIMYVVALGTLDERVAWALLEKLPVVGELTHSGTANDIAQALRGMDDIEAALDRIVASMPVGREWTVDDAESEDEQAG